MFGRPHNPEYARERLPLEGPRAGNPQGLRDAHWVVFSAARSQRPGAFRNPKDATAKESCPFCEGHETMTPPEVLAYRDGGKPDGPGWSIRCVPNKFPALELVGEVREHRDSRRVIVREPRGNCRSSRLRPPPPFPLSSTRLP